MAAAVAVLAAVVAVRATAVLARMMLAHEATRKETSVREQHAAAAAPALAARVVDGKTRRGVGDDTRDYAFTTQLTNNSGSERQIASALLRVTYRTRANFLGAVDLATEDRVSIPSATPVDATFRFSTSNIIPRHSRIDGYTLLLTDDRGERLVVDASLPAVLQADTDGAGPATWGWD